MELTLRALRKGANQLLLESLRVSETVAGNAKRDRKLQPTAPAGRCSQAHEKEREGRSALLISPANLPLMLPVVGRIK